MKYPYHVKYNDVMYEPYEEVPNDVKVVETKEQPRAIEETVAREEVKEEPKVVQQKVTLNKTDINRMSVADLKKLASKVGIVGYEDKSGATLKSEIIAKFNL